MNYVVLIFLTFTNIINADISFYDYLNIKIHIFDFFSVIHTKNFLDSITFDNKNYVKINLQ